MKTYTRLIGFVALLVFPLVASAADLTLGTALEEVIAQSGAEETATSVRLIVLLTALTLLPALMLAMTPFTRFIIVFSLLRQALGLQQSPPNQVLIGLSLALSLLVMQPTLTEAYESGVSPYMAGELGTAEAYDASIGPMRTFMLSNTSRDDLMTAMRLGRMARPDTLSEVPTPVVLTGFLLSELRTALVIGIKVYIPFVMIDIVVASSLLGMGMMMLPPVVVSLPFKLLVFVLMDGWGLLVTGLAGGIR